MGKLAWNLGINGLLNPEDDVIDGAKEEWFVVADAAAYSQREVGPSGWV